MAAIESITEQSPQAIHVNRIYDMARDITLTDVSPSWAVTQAVLTLLTDEVTGFSFVYGYPADCLSDLEIYNPAKVNQNQTLEYQVRINASGNTKIICTNYEDAELIYVLKVTNPVVFDQLFVEALSWKIAAMSAIPLKGDDRLAQMVGRGYSMAVGNAKAFTKNQGYKLPDASNSFTDARL